MAKINVNKIVEDMQKLYQKDKKVQTLITTGNTVKQKYTEKDGVPLSAGHPFRVLSGLPVLPFNKIVEFAGKPDSGKSTIAAELIVAAQQAQVQVIVWDSEDKLDSNRLKNMGAKPEEVLLIKTNEILKGAELSRRYITAVKEQDENAKILFVWDSVGGSQSRSHAERELDSEKHSQPGQDAKENGSVMKMLVALINKYPDTITVYLANQTYAKIGMFQFGDAAAGGSKIEYHASFIVMLKRIKTLTKVVKGVKVKYGIVTQATVSKNHLSQDTTSVHQLAFQITAEGTKLTEDNDSDDDET